jgi:flagellar biosynthesis protein FlhG
MHILPVASGKGGVGKSLFVANLGIALGKAGKRVVLVDLDLGGSNLHLLLGLRHLSSGIGVFLNESRANFADIIYETDYQNVRFVPGDSEIPGMANVTPAQKRKLMSRLLAIDTDYLILDLGAGTSSHTIDFWLLSGMGIIVSTPTPTALVNAYLFLKNAVFRVIQQSLPRGTDGQLFIDRLLKDGGSLQKIYIQDLLTKLENVDHAGSALVKQAFARFHPRLVFNMIEDPKDSEKAYKLRRSCQQYLGIDLEHLGIMYRDDVQDTALQAGLPIVSYKPKAVLSQAVYRIADKLLQFELEAADGQFLAPESSRELDQSYETAEAEADVDFQIKLDYLEDLVQSGALSMGDLLETVKSQQLEISHIRKENQLLKTKLLAAAAQGFKL